MSRVPQPVMLVLLLATDATAQEAMTTLPSIELPALEVRAEALRERGDGPVQGYRATNTLSATRTDTPIREIPQSVSVVPRAVVEDLQATRVEAALDYAGGVARQNDFGGQTLFEYAVRGFTTGEFFRNGFPVNRGYQSNPDSATIERIEVLRGPAALLYGRGDPGGTINLVTRQPTPVPTFGGTFLLGERGTRRAVLESSGPLDPQGRFAHRLIFGTERRESFRDVAPADRQFVAPLFAWRTEPDTTFTLEGEFLQNDQPFDRGIVAVGNRLGAVPRSRFLGEPSDGRFRNRNAMVQGRVEHRLNSDWTLRAGMQYLGGTLTGFSTENNRLLADGRTLLRERRFRDYAWDDYTLQATLEGRFTTGPLRHTLLLGVEHDNFRGKEILLRSNPATAPFSIDILSPRYGGPLPPLTRRTDALERTISTSFFMQDQVAVTDRMRLLAGLRVEHSDQDLRQRATGITTPQERTAVLPRVGVMYDLLPQLSLYGSWARSFRPNRGAGATGSPFAPEQGESFELGTKLDLLEERLSVTAALFHIEKQNVLTADPAGGGFSIAAGAARSRGFDVSVAGEVAPGWRVIGGYAYVDAEVIRDNAIRPGTPLLNIPRHSLSLLGVREFREGPLEGLSLGAGLVHVSSRLGDTGNTAFRLPGHTTVDLLASYQITPRARVNVTVTNLFDTTYYERSFSSVWVSPGAPRTVAASLAIRF
ncbi:TonB-dependent siderophore receptor [Sabulicella glaciei]|uniref:TonB-dependent siderophore receptor n=1 Tax=Sabulicella glaciei TaxID=2984948 RepID=A0ABT3NR01_9PROT|nr:TonB-dependent siderophore receptor [Roseococcus sp. MDT2-1-1]MCW8084024.1 TonB-dependent siderophore receptor [Roseococcus sp. MDT2-1-1]